MANLLDNIVWEALSGPQQKYSIGGNATRRYAPGFSPIAGFANPVDPNLAQLAEIFESGESFYTDIWSGPVPSEWNLEAEATMFKMVWEGTLPKLQALDAVELGPEHAEQAVELAVLTNPGPFGLRTLELGDYYGYFDGSKLIAMSGERFEAGSLREVSGVCTHPDYQGRGLARTLMSRVIRQQMLRGETPFLHVMTRNEVARGLYKRMGFVDYLETVVRVVSKVG